MFWLWTLLVYWLILFVICYVVGEYGQNYLYDETTPFLGLKVLGGTFILAALLTRFRSSYDTMFTSEIHWTVLQAVVWFVVFTLVFRFHPKHAASLGIMAFLIGGGLAGMAVDSLSARSPVAARNDVLKPNKPLRRPAGGAPISTGSEPGKVQPSMPGMGIPAGPEKKAP
jgi:hypothetical protein